jgi:hypothetical protein
MGFSSCLNAFWHQSVLYRGENNRGNMKARQKDGLSLFSVWWPYRIKLVTTAIEVSGAF